LFRKAGLPRRLVRDPVTKPDDYKAKAEEYKRLAQACVDPEEKKKLEKLEQDCRDLALAAQ
jgi:hypothetical protein